MTRLSRSGLALSLILPFVACDQATKAIAARSLGGSPPVAYLDGIVRFQLAENAGGFMSMGATMPESWRMILFMVLVPLGLAVLAIAILRSGVTSGTAIAGLSLMLAGGIGNLLDRIFNDGVVVDFVSVGFGPLRTGIFNVADVAIIAGVMIFALDWRGDAAAESDPSTAGVGPGSGGS